jgi:hypothetical protein
LNPVTKFNYPNYELSWEQPNDGGSQITGYQIYVFDGARDQRFTPARDTDCVMINPTAQRCTLDAKSMLQSPYSLTRKSSYYFTVKAQNAYGESPDSLPSNYQEIVTPPESPIQLKHYPKESTDTMVSMSWEDGADDGGMPITGYRVQVARDESMSVPLNDIAYPSKKAKVGQL